MTFLALPFPPIDPVLVDFGPVAIRWYALAYVGGLLFGWWYASRLAETPALWGGPSPLTRNDIGDLILWATLGVIAGGRLGYVLFYAPGYFLQNPAEILIVWQGGMSFHGGFAGVVLAIAAFAARRGLPLAALSDVVAAAAPVGLLLGRLANFANAELWGRVTDVPWAFVFPGAGPDPRHPSQLYQAALEGIVLFVILRVLTHHYGALRRPWLVTGAFLAGYGAARIIGEIFRQPDAHIGFLWGGLTMGMALSAPMLLAGLAVVAYAVRRPLPQAAR